MNDSWKLQGYSLEPCCHTIKFTIARNGEPLVLDLTLDAHRLQCVHRISKERPSGREVEALKDPGSDLSLSKPGPSECRER